MSPSAPQAWPLLIQALVEHFAAECRELDTAGVVVSDWSAYELDEHTSRCVASYVVTRELDLHPSVYYAGSKAAPAIQFADLIAGATRMTLEGSVHLAVLDHPSTNARALPAAVSLHTHLGHPYRNRIQLF